MGRCYSLHQDCMGDDSSRRVVGVSVWCIVHVRHIRVNTSLGSIYIIFLICFQDVKPMYTYNVFKNLYVVWKNTGSLWPYPGSMRFKEWFRPPMNLLSMIMIPQTIFMKCFTCDQYDTYFIMFNLLYVMYNLSFSSTRSQITFIIYIHLLFSFLIELLSVHARMFHTLQVNLRLVSRSGGAATSPWRNIKV